MSAWVYMLRLSDGRLYTGWAVDPLARLRAHLAGRGSRLVRALAPAAIVYLEPMAGRGEALRREAAIKRLRRPAKLALVAAGAEGTRRHLSDLDGSLPPGGSGRSGGAT